MNQVHSAVQTGLLKMAMNSQVQTAQNIIEDFAAAPANPEHLGNNLDVYL